MPIMITKQEFGLSMRMVNADKLIGLYHFLGDRTPLFPEVAPKPRKINPWRRDGRVLVSRVTVEKALKLSVGNAIALLGSVDQAIKRGDRILVKPNFNSPDPFPASTDLAFLRAVIEILLESGAKVIIGESAGGLWRPSRNVFRKLGVYELARNLGVEAIAFEDSKSNWLRIRINGDYLKSVTMPRSAYEADKIVYLPCMKTHNLARYSGALKLAFGFVHPGERRRFHVGHLEQKLAEVSLCWQPDLIIMDGRKAFVTGGPDKGELVEPGLIFASGDLVAIDMEAIKVLLSYHARNRLDEPERLPQIATALKHGLGSNDYIVVE